MKLRVKAKYPLTETIVGVDLEAVEGALPGFTAGAHIDLQLGEGLCRQYSLCNPAQQPQLYQLAVLIDPNSRGGSIAVAQLKVGDLLEASEPKNHFALQPASRYRLFAAGIGITPIWAMANQLNASGGDYRLYYRTRNAAQTAYLNELSAPEFAGRVEHSYSSEGAMAFDRMLADPGSDERLYVCGPQRFIDELLERAVAAGWRSDQLHREYFNAEIDTSATGRFRVRVAATGDEYEVPEDLSIAEVLEQAGHYVPLSCSEGVCGTCMVPVLEGTPDHRDFYMTDDEHAANDMITLCCSRSKSDLLVVDI